MKPFENIKTRTKDAKKVEVLDKAISKLLGSDKYGTVFDRAAQYYSAKILKDAVIERAKKYE